MRPPLPIGTHGNITTTKQPNGKWKARTYYRDHTGKRRDITTTAPTKAAATHRLKEKIANYHPVEQQLNTTKLKDFTQTWYNTYKTTVGTSAQRQTQIIINNHINPVGDKRLNEITVPWLDKQIQKAQTKTTHNGRTTGGTSTALRLRVTYKMILAEAVRQGALLHNPAEKTRPIKRETEPVKALTPQQLTYLRTHIRNFYDTYPYWTRAKTWLPDLVDFLVGTGCRVGEAIALRWEDVDLEKGICTIRATAQIEKGASVYQPFTKTKQERAVVLPDWLVLVLVSRVPSEGFVFCVKDGGMAKYSTLKGAFAKALPDDLVGITPKIIRASVATMIERELGLEAAGIQLGHDDFKTTRKSYIERRGISDASKVLRSL